MPDVPSVAVFAVVYGASGLGKSTDMAATFPRGLFVCRPGGMQSAASFLGASVAEAHVRTLEEVIALIPVAKERGHDAIVVDDLSLLAESTERDVDAAMAASGDRNKFAKFNHLNGLAAALREQGRYVGIHFVANAHERPPGTDTRGSKRDGGPRLPSWNMGDSVVHEASLVLRTTRDTSRRAQWKSVYDCRHEAGWVGKDRLTAAAARSPQNLRSILTAGGYRLTRVPGLEWQDEVSKAVARKADEGMTPEEIVEELWPKLVGHAGLDPRHVAWAVRDGLATVELRDATADRFRTLFNLTPSNGVSALFGST